MDINTNVSAMHAAASLNKTQVYTHVSKERLRAVYGDTHPRA